MKTAIPQKNKVRSELQKEIESVCPFCNNEEVGHFEIHHIDENPSNHDKQNLILICPNCHSKITKGDISQHDVIDQKIDLRNKGLKIQFIAVNVDSKNCGWVQIENTPNAFEAKYLKSLFPILNFSFINQSNRTMLLTNIKIKAKRLPIGLSAPNIPLPNILRPLIKYKIKLPLNDEACNKILNEEIEVPMGRAFKFQIELYDDSMERFKPPINKYALFFEFGFNNDFHLKVPMILLNTGEYYEKLKIYGLG